MIVDEHGPQVLSSATMVSNLLKDLLPDVPRVRKILVAAAEDRIADQLSEHVAQGVDGKTAARLAASSFAASTMFTPEACAWVAGEFAVALGIAEASEPPTVIAARSLGPEAPADFQQQAAVPDRAAIAALSTQFRAAEPEAPRQVPAPRPLNIPQARRVRVTMTAYVANLLDGTITPVDLTTGMAGAPISAGRSPIAIAISPDGATAYVVSSADDAVIPVSLATGTTGAPIGAGTSPNAIAIARDGSIAYVTSQHDEAVTPIDLATQTAGRPIRTWNGPVAIALTPDGKGAYVADRRFVTPLDLSTGTAGRPIRAGDVPVAIAITPDGATAYVASEDGAITQLHLPAGTRGTQIRFGSTPRALAITRTGTQAFALSGRRVIPLDLSSGSAGKPMRAGKDPRAVVLTDEGTRAYVADYGDGSVIPLDLISGTPGKPIKVGNGPVAMAIA